MYTLPSVKILWGSAPRGYRTLSDDKDFRAARRWKHELGNFHDHARGLAEGFLDGNIEILHLEDEVAVVIYHFRQPETLPVTMPLGFMTTNKELVV